ncbi:MAG TPA: NrfD/PsrC family molybdoenzyme membrane anchor subunit [Thermoanaerobaculia bacterium]|nr:NrfD/PsrC family molybdoenzyme membrane anchor subunit [Thermoanaerobaculia bacterium]
MTDRRPDAKSERRLDDLRREAGLTGTVNAKGIRPAGSPLPVASPETGYYGLPLLKPPVWTWEVPTYFFVGGAAGAAAVLAATAQLARVDPKLVRDARWIAAIGANLSAPLLIADLGRPQRFLNMMRVFKPQSPMSVGAWTLAAFGGASTATVIFKSQTLGIFSALTGAVMCTYTGVLLGATAIPVWSEHANVLPMHFGASAVGSAVALLELRGHMQPALNILGTTAATFETLTGVATESRHKPTDTLIRLGGVLSGPVPLALRALGRTKRARRIAAVSSLVGSLITRFAWVRAGKKSAEVYSNHG